MSKALITGATGLLGRAVTTAFKRAEWDVVGTGFSRGGEGIVKVDLKDAEAVERVLDTVKPQVVVHCAANRFPDACDADPAGTKALNVLATHSLARLTAARNILLIYISTDYVFPGTPGEAPYATDAAPQPTNLYGETKRQGEEAVIQVYKDAGKEGRGVVLRVPVLYGHVEEKDAGGKGYAESAVNSLVDKVWEAQKKKIKMDHWARRYPTNTEDVGRVLVDIAQHYLANPSPSALPHILHFSGKERFTKYELCLLFAEILGLSTENIVPETAGNDPNAVVQRPYDCHLSNKALEELGVSTSSQDFRGWWRWELRAVRR